MVQIMKDTLRRWKYKPESLSIEKSLLVQVNTFEPYGYDELGRDEIRLLDLHGIVDGSDLAIRCSLRTVKLDRTRHAVLFDEETRYYALTYAWGTTCEDESHLTDSVVCEGRMLSVTHNLHAALKQIRQNMANGHFRAPMLIWVDAICIDQQNLEERAA